MQILNHLKNIIEWFTEYITCILRVLNGWLNILRLNLYILVLLMYINNNINIE